MKYGEFLEVAEKLLFSPDFKELEAKLEFPEPNIWHILGISRKEALVTRFLVWLLDPQSQHSFGARFLKNLVIETLKTGEGSIPNGANQTVNGELVAFNGARRVRREGWGNTSIERQGGAPYSYST